MPSLIATITQFIVLHAVGSGVVDSIATADTPAAQQLALQRSRRADHQEPPPSVAKDWSVETLDVGAPLHLLRDDHPSVMLYLHGGAYVTGPNTQQWRMAAMLAQDAGVDLAVLSYGLAPEAQVDAAIAATTASLDALAERYDTVTLFGDSAGGGLAVASMQAQRDRGGPLPALAVLFSPWVDAVLDAPELAEAEQRDILLSIEGLRGCARLFGGDLPLDDPRLSPLRAPLHGLPTVLIHVGTDELLLQDIRHFQAELQAAGVPSELHEHEGMQHDFFLFPCPESSRVMASMAAKLRQAAALSED